MDFSTIGKISTNTVTSSSINSKETNGKLNFKDFIIDAFNNVNNLQIEAENYKKLLATGQVENIHEVMIAGEKANLALQLTLSIRNKVVDAYREIMRMQI